ncbi:MAG: hypothetical protein ACI3V0_11645 [Faecousia sp.]
MESIQIENTTYLVRRVFVGKKSVPELLQERLQADHSQLFPLTDAVPFSYNNGGNSLRCEEAQ